MEAALSNSELALRVVNYSRFTGHQTSLGGEMLPSHKFFDIGVAVEKLAAFAWTRQTALTLQKSMTA